MNPITGLLTALGVLTAVYVAGWAQVCVASSPGRSSASRIAHGCAVP